MTAQQADILIAGGGAVGLSLATALADALGAEARIVVVDRDGFEAPANDAAAHARAYAVAAASKHLLAAVGAWEGVAPYAQAVTSIDITDSSLSDAFRPKLLGYDNRLADEAEAATHIVSDRRIRDSLLAAIKH